MDKEGCYVKSTTIQRVLVSKPMLQGSGVGSSTSAGPKEANTSG